MGLGRLWIHAHQPSTKLCSRCLWEHTQKADHVAGDVGEILGEMEYSWIIWGSECEVSTMSQEQAHDGVHDMVSKIHIILMPSGALSSVCPGTPHSAVSPHT